jgi:putative redox protein
MTEPPAATSPHASIHVEWLRGVEFEAGRQGGPTVRIDGDANSGPSPVDVLLAAVATCAAVDVVTILKKQRTPAESLHVRIDAQRVNAVPRRLASAVLSFTIAAPGATRDKVARAVELSVTRYCSVRSSLIADAAVTWKIDLKP